MLTEWLLEGSRVSLFKVWWYKCQRGVSLGGRGLSVFSPKLTLSIMWAGLENIRGEFFFSFLFCEYHVNRINIRTSSQAFYIILDNKDLLTSHCWSKALSEQRVLHLLISQIHYFKLVPHGCLFFFIRFWLYSHHLKVQKLLGHLLSRLGSLYIVRDLVKIHLDLIRRHQ